MAEHNSALEEDPCNFWMLCIVASMDVDNVELPTVLSRASEHLHQVVMVDAATTSELEANIVSRSSKLKELVQERRGANVATCQRKAHQQRILAAHTLRNDVQQNATNGWSSIGGFLEGIE